MIRTILGISFLLLCTGFVLAQETEKEKAVSLVTKASEYLKTNGREKGIAVLSDSAGQFSKGDLYVFAYDFDGVMMAHPKNPKLIGKNLLEVPDVDGKLFRKEIIQTAKEKGSGWVDYKYKNPETSKVEPKTTYLVKEGDLILCCGIYK